MTAIREEFRPIFQVVRPPDQGGLAPFWPKRPVPGLSRDGISPRPRFQAIFRVIQPTSVARDSASTDRETGVFGPQGAKSPGFGAWRPAKWTEIPVGLPPKIPPCRHPPIFPVSCFLRSFSSFHIWTSLRSRSLTSQKSHGHAICELRRSQAVCEYIFS